MSLAVMPAGTEIENREAQVAGATISVADVIVPLPMPQAFTYSVPDELLEHATPGCRVLVPFGRRSLTGMVVSRRQAAPSPGIKAIKDVLDEEPAFTEELLKLTEWISAYYVCGWGEAMRAALPSGINVEEAFQVRWTGRDEAQIPSGKAGNILMRIREHGSIPIPRLRKMIRNTSLAMLRRLETEGWIAIDSVVETPKVRIRYVKYIGLGASYRNQAAFKTLLMASRGEKQRVLLNTLWEKGQAGEWLQPQADMLKLAGASSTTLNRLVERGVVIVEEREMIRTPLGQWPAVPDDPPQHELHAAQQTALDAIGGALDAGRFEAFLLHGVTGSGKTEVYIAALQRVLEQGKTGIILVPEIALTPQTVQRFRAHFGDRIAVLHSRMSPGERFDAWRCLRDGRYSVVIGPRSAVLAPLSNIGLIVVDEEHETSYKQFDPAPRYHARDVAVMRAHMNDAVCILGSATPSLESYVNATEAGKYTLLRMPERVPVPGIGTAVLPEVRIVDLTKEKKKQRLNGSISDTLRLAISDRLARGEQVILLQNRRGYAPVLECTSCGWTPSCSDCSVTMTFHKAQGRLRCHYCGQTRPIIHQCEQCGGVELTRLGTGTQRVEEELEGYFPDTTILRMDLDTTSRRNAHLKILDQFARGEAGILLGTQMVAKGLDFGNVTLVGVINTDEGLLLPDFRAEERAFQLLTQVAGRAGRAELKGEVMFQTRNPSHAVLRFAREHNYEAFAHTMLEQRRELSYPPYGRMVRVEFRGPNGRSTELLARRWAAAFPAVEYIQLLGPQPGFLERVKRQYRYQAVLKVNRKVSSKMLQDLLRKTTAHCGTPPKDHRIAIDVDAVGLF